MQPRRTLLRPVGIAALAIQLGGCGILFASACPSGQIASSSEVLYFGTAKRNGGEVSAAEWQGFLDEVVTPRFPQGLSVFAAKGQWREQSGQVLRESSYVLNVVHPGGEYQQQALSDIAAEYRRRFDQESVLQVSSKVCAAF